MSNETSSAGDHVGDKLSGFIDNELTQQDRQLVELHCEDCDRCRTDLEDLKALRERIGHADLGELDAHAWGERMNETGVKLAAMVGWSLLIGGVLLLAGFFVAKLLFSDEVGLMEKLVALAIYGGLAALLISVLRQRLIERKTDKYRNVRI